PPEIESRTVRAGPWRIRTGTIRDLPRYRWRGAMLDVARHFFDVADVQRYVDLLALYKLNRLHLHLTDDQGWRFESKRYPRLTEIGAWRAETAGDGTPHGGSYQQDDLRELVAYAAARHVTVLPEIDLPGHTQAVLAAYPELGTGPVQVATAWGASRDMLVPDERGARFCTEILSEVLDVFPGRHVHIGGDECGGQPWFTRELVAFLRHHGRTAICWDDALGHDLPPEVTIMAWRGRDKAGAAALEAGHQVVIASSEATYLDFAPSDCADEPRSQPWLLTLEQVCQFDPVPAGYRAEQVLGTQFQLWTEFMPGPADVEYKAFPRATALAEIAWSGGPLDPTDFTERLHAHLRRLDVLGVNYRPLDGPRPWQRGGTGSRRQVPLAPAG
ncbi:MAG TPA: family 20 glycosylhydrolase, partial [Actinoplanes sp.]|nr:family 20 glycosylhydrolase [Actinoplanes sp.]